MIRLNKLLTVPKVIVAIMGILSLGLLGVSMPMSEVTTAEAISPFGLSVWSIGVISGVWWLFLEANKK